MQETHSRVGKIVDRITASDEPHDNYRGHDPWTGERLDNGIPILKSTPAGNIICKEVTHCTVKCPECEVRTKYTHISEPVCPECGIVCAGKDVILSEQLVRDAKAAGRFDSDKEESPA